MIVIKIPDELKRRVEMFCGEMQYTPDGLAVTLIGPSLLGTTPGLEQKLQTFCLGQADFNLIIGGPSCFNNRLLYLNVLPGMINIMRSRLADYLKLPQTEKAYRPHLTIMRSTPERAIDLNRTLYAANAAFPAPYAFTVSELHLYTKGKKDSVYKPSAIIPFTGR